MSQHVLPVKQHTYESKAWNTTISSTQAKCNIYTERFFLSQTVLSEVLQTAGVKKLFKDWHDPYTHTHTYQKNPTSQAFHLCEMFTNLNTDIVIKVTHLPPGAQERQGKVRQVRKKPPLRS